MRNTVRAAGALAGLAALLVVPACSAVGGSTTSMAAATHAVASAEATATSSPGPAASPRAAAAGSVTISAVGDTMLGDTPDLPPDPGTYLKAVEPALDEGAGIVFGNLEGTLTTATAGKCGPAAHPVQNCYAFRDPPAYARYLKQAGFTILNDANNHSLDFGAAGQAQTVQAIHAAGLAQTGLPGEITLVKANGVRVAFLAFAPYNYDA